MRTAVVLLLAAALAAGYSGGPPDGKTGRPGEGNCADCHVGTASGDSSDLAGLAGGVYHPESSYTLTLRLNYAGQTRWGFEVTAVDESGTAAGLLFLVDSTNTQVSTSGGLQYLKQTSAGTRRGMPDVATWQFGWRAPGAGTGPVTFYWSGNACDGNGSTSGDFAIPSSLTVTEASGIEESRAARRFHWYYVNPSRNRVIIDYEGLPEQPVRIYSAEGQLVATVNPTERPGGLRVSWNGQDRNGDPVPEAAYYVRLGEEISAVAKVQLVR